MSDSATKSSNRGHRAGIFDIRNIIGALLGIDGLIVTEIGFEQAVQRIRGPEGSSVVLLVRRAAGGEPAEIVVTRRRIRR